MTKVLDWQKHWNGKSKVQTIAEWMWLQNSNNIVAILRQLEQSILSIAAKILETLALSILLYFTPNHELEHWAVGGSSEILNIFDEAGKIFFFSEFCFNVAANGCYDAKNILPLKLHFHKSSYYYCVFWQMQLLRFSYFSIFKYYIDVLKYPEEVWLFATQRGKWNCIINTKLALATFHI